MEPERVSVSRYGRFPHAFPFLIAMASVLYLAAENPHEGLTLSNLRDPLVLALLYVFVVWATLSLFVKDRLRRSLVTTAVGVTPLVSGYLFGWLRGQAIEPALRGAIETGALVALMLIGTLVILRVRWLPNAAKFLNIFSSLLVLLTVPALLSLGTPEDDTSREHVSEDAGGAKPDIYLVVLDAYSGNESLIESYEFDNSAIHDSLQERGFKFPTRSRSNYTTTFLSVGSMLNRGYVNDLAEQTGPDYRDRTALYRYLEFNRTTRDLKGLGYEFVYVGSSYPPMASNRLADVQYSEIPSREFERLWTRMTVLPAVLAMVCPLTSRCVSSALHFGPESAAETEDRLAFLNSSVNRQGPKFVYAHWLLPHGPFRFAQDCRPIAPSWTTGDMMIENDSLARRRYVDQLVCTNRKILEFVDAVRATASDSSVIILQADHGDGRFPGGRPSSLEAADPDQIRERFDVFAAYAGPSGIGDSLALQRTPVNVMRTLVRVLFGFSEPPSEDRHFWSGRDRPLYLVSVDIDSLFNAATEP
ncbi:MAG TPA: hypothetical protein VLA33_06695 [Gemmatimonadota bacterium]|nr:hypothetical protein [Gemmatimonadota bacterium]